MTIASQQFDPDIRKLPYQKKKSLKKITLAEIVKSVKDKNPNKRIRVFAQDESRLGLQSILRKVWSPVGERPVINIYPRYDWFYVCSAVEPITGEHHTLIWSTMNLASMQYWLDSFSESLKDDIAILVCDQAGWHSEKGLKWPDNIIRCPLPAYSPECNPAERLWTWLRERLANKVFESIDVMKNFTIDVINDWDNFKPMLVSMLNFWWWKKAVI